LWYYVSLFGLALAVSLDGFSVGVAYGIRKMKISFMAILIIALCSGSLFFLSMTLGQILFAWVPKNFASWIGACFFIVIGIWAFFQKPSAQDPVEGELPPQEWTLEFKQLGLVVKILRTPTVADLDRSGSISSREAFLLGTALSMDAFGAGLGASILGYSPLPVSLLIAVMSVLFLHFGMKVGLKIVSESVKKWMDFLPGCLLILMGLYRFWKE
jgi:putative sporulation protein YtaF